MNKIKIYTDKSPKLNNAVLKKVDIEKYQLLDEQVILIDSFVKSKGVIPVGPLI